MKPLMTALVGGVLGVLTALMLGVVTFGIGMAREQVYAIPYLWRGGVEPVADGFEFVIAPHGGGILALVVAAAVAGLLLGLRSGDRSGGRARVGTESGSRA